MRARRGSSPQVGGRSERGEPERGPEDAPPATVGGEPADGDEHAVRIAEYFAGVAAAQPSEMGEAAREEIAERAYVLCFVNRSGSNLLAASLGATGVLGNPREFFDHGEVVEACRAKGIRSLPAYTREVVRASATPNGVYGTKLGAGQLRFLYAEGIIGTLLRNPLFVYVTRRDVVAQAVSFVVASQTGRWTSELPGNGAEPRYDREAIAAHLRWIHRSQELFERTFADHGVQPLRLVYEELADRLEGAVAAIAEALGLPAPPVVPREQIRLKMQRTALNEELKARFLAEPEHLR